MRSLCGVLVLGLVVSASYRLQAQGSAHSRDLSGEDEGGGPGKRRGAEGTQGRRRADAVAPAKTASAAFADIEKFWAAQKKDDAVKLAASARMGFADAAAAAAKGDLMAAQMAAGNATANCKQCHGLYREGDPQAGFKFKAGAVN